MSIYSGAIRWKSGRVESEIHYELLLLLLSRTRMTIVGTRRVLDSIVEQRRLVFVHCGKSTVHVLAEFKRHKWDPSWIGTEWVI